MSEELFKNRRGHTVTTVQEAIDVLPEPEHKTEPPKPVRRKKPRFRPSRFQVRVGLIVLAVIILVPICIGEYVRMTYVGEVTSAKKEVASLLVAVVESQKSTVRSDTLSGVEPKLLAVYDKLCAGGLFDNIAQAYPRSQQALSDCTSYRSKLGALDSSVKEAVAQMVYLEKLQPKLTGVTEPLEEQFAVLTAQQENWQAFVDGLKQSSVPTSFTAAHTGLSTQAEAIRDQWIALVQASNAFDSAKFRDARTKLTAAYAAFRASQDGFTSAVTVNQQSVLHAVQAL